MLRIPFFILTKHIRKTEMCLDIPHSTIKSPREHWKPGWAILDVLRQELKVLRMPILILTLYVRKRG